MRRLNDACAAQLAGNTGFDGEFEHALRIENCGLISKKRANIRTGVNLTFSIMSGKHITDTSYEKRN